MEVFGITGTNGKTTTSYMLDAIIRACGKDAALVGTVTHRIGESIYEAVNTTPGKKLFARYMKEAEEQGIDVLITEVSSHALAQGRLDDVPVKYAAFTNLTRDHMDYHESIENYYLAKRRLFDFKTLKSAILNIDDEHGVRIYKELKDGNSRLNVVSVSLCNPDADFFADVNEESFAGTRFTLRRKESQGEEFFIGTPGRYNVYNAVMAVSMAYESAGETVIGCAAEALKGFHGAPGRFEIRRKNGITAVCDYAHTPDALDNLLRAVRNLKEKDAATRDGRVITVFGCGGNRDSGKRTVMGEISGRLSDFTIITSDNPRNEDPERIIRDIEEGIIPSNAKYMKEPDRKAAITKAVMLAEPGDVIVVAGKGHEDYQIIGDVKKHFDDREILGELLV